MGINIVPSGSNETMRISDDNKIGININDPNYTLDINGTVGISGDITAVIDGGSIS